MGQGDKNRHYILKILNVHCVSRGYFNYWEDDDNFWQEIADSLSLQGADNLEEKEQSKRFYNQMLEAAELGRNISSQIGLGP